MCGVTGSQLIGVLRGQLPCHLLGFVDLSAMPDDFVLNLGGLETSWPLNVTQLWNVENALMMKRSLICQKFLCLLQENGGRIHWRISQSSPMSSGRCGCFCGTGGSCAGHWGQARTIDLLLKNRNCWRLEFTEWPELR